MPVILSLWGFPPTVSLVCVIQIRLGFYPASLKHRVKWLNILCIGFYCLLYRLTKWNFKKTFYVLVGKCLISYSQMDILKIHMWKPGNSPVVTEC